MEASSLLEVSKKVLQSIHTLTPLLDEPRSIHTYEEARLLQYVHQATRELQDSLLAWGIHYAHECPAFRFSSLLRLQSVIQNSPHECTAMEISSSRSKTKRTKSLFDIPYYVLVSTVFGFLTSQELLATSHTCKALARNDPPVTLLEHAAKIQCQRMLGAKARLVRKTWTGETWTQILFHLERQDLVQRRSTPLACSLSHSIAIHPVSHAVFSCGEATAALGQGNIQEDVLQFREIPGLKHYRIVQVTAGSDHTLVRTEEGKVFSFGKNNGGQLGVGNTQSFNEPQLISYLDGRSIKWIAAGEDHSLAIARDGSVFTFGFGNFGKLGHGDSTHQVYPRKVQALEPFDIVQCVAGTSHSIFLTSEGNVYTCGSGREGQHGHGLPACLATPCLLKTLASHRVIQIAASSNSSACVTSHGKLFVFGNITYGSSFVDHALPTTLSHLNQDTVVTSVFLGPTHLFLQLGDERMLAFGRGEALGAGTFDDIGQATELASLQHLHCNFIASSLYHTLAYTRDSKLYSWGVGQGGVLGTGNESDQPSPHCIHLETLEISQNE